MIDLDLGRYQKARVWLDQPAFVAPCDEHGPSRRRTASSGLVPVAHKQVVVEAWLPREPMRLYGLLGATVTLNPALDAIALEVPVSSTDVSVDEAKTLSHHSGALTLGLSENLADVVADEAETVLRARPFTAAQLRFDVAVISTVGSVPVLFRGLTRAILALMALPRDEIEDVAHLMRECLSLGR